MKRFFLLIAVLGLLIYCPSAMAAGSSASATYDKIAVGGGPARCIITLTTMSDDGTGATPDFEIVGKTYGIEGWYLYSVETDAQTAGTTADWDMYVYNAGKTFDLAQGLCTNRNSANAEMAYLASVGYPMMVTKFVISTANTGNAKSIVSKFTFVQN